jgi:hypothetical protein
MTLSTHSQEVARLLPVNPELASYASARVESVIGLLDSISNLFTEYTDHSSSHSLAVLRVGSLLSAGNDLNP